MRVLVVGSGGREHALAWKLSKESEVFACPGNPGIAAVAECKAGDPVEVAQALRPDLVVIGPENPLIDGLADPLREQGLPVFGPGAAGARLEGSKAYSKEQMIRAGVPTAAHETFTAPSLARDYVRARNDIGRQVVVKASGAALGKGAIVCSNYAEADDAIAMMMEDREFGDAGSTVVIEDRMSGREFSLLTVCGDSHYWSLPVAQDYKRALDGDRGPNTGGMGTYSPVPWVTAEMVSRTESEIVAPMLRNLAEQGVQFRGVLFSGVMAEEGRVFCIEYNVRFGDPEIQTLVQRIDAGLSDLLLAAAVGGPLNPLDVLPNAAITVAIASGGYPGTYEKGLPITLPPSLPEGVEVFHAGTAMKDGRLVTSGGRVLGVSAQASTGEEARALAYAVVEQVKFEGKSFRSDIGL